MKELKLRLRHHLPHEILQPGKEFQEVFDALTLKNKIALGEYSFLCDVFFRNSYGSWNDNSGLSSKNYTYIGYVSLNTITQY